jgi:hypothetical protein
MVRAPTKGTRHGNGSGRGGEAVGAGTGGPALGSELKPFQKFNRESVGHAPGDKERKAWRRQKAWEMENLLDHLAENGENEMVRKGAAERLHAICDGMPVARTELTGKDGGPLQSVSATTTDPVEAARIYQEMIGSK